MKELKITKGEWENNNTSIRTETGQVIAFSANLYDADQIEVQEEGESWLDMRKRTEPERVLCGIEQRANAQLIAEAGTVANETGMMPREIQQQNETLKSMLSYVAQKIENSEHWWMNDPDKGGFDLDAIKKLLPTSQG